MSQRENGTANQLINILKCVLIELGLHSFIGEEAEEWNIFLRFRSRVWLNLWQSIFPVGRNQLNRDEDGLEMSDLVSTGIVELQTRLIFICSEHQVRQSWNSDRNCQCEPAGSWDTTVITTIILTFTSRLATLRPFLKSQLKFPPVNFPPANKYLEVFVFSSLFYINKRLIRTLLIGSSLTYTVNFYSLMAVCVRNRSHWRVFVSTNCNCTRHLYDPIPLFCLFFYVIT